MIEGLQPAWLSSVHQRNLYICAIELLDGLLIMLLAGLFVGMFAGPLEGLMYGVGFGRLCRGPLSWPRAKPIFGLRSRFVFGMLGGQIFGPSGEPVFGISRGLDSTIQEKDRLRWSFRRGLLKGGSSSLIIGLIVWLLICLSFGLHGEQLNEQYDGMLDTPFIGLLLGLFFGVFTVPVVGPLAILIAGLNTIPLKEKEIPNQGIGKGIQNSLLVMLAAGLMTSMTVGLVARFSAITNDWATNLTVGLRVGIPVGVSAGIFFGLDAAIQHLILRIFLTINGSTPWNYARFLDHAVKHRFIQRTGGRYRFVHDLLRKHFAAMPLE